MDAVQPHSVKAKITTISLSLVLRSASFAGTGTSAADMDILHKEQKAIKPVSSVDLVIIFVLGLVVLSAAS